MLKWLSCSMDSTICEQQQKEYMGMIALIVMMFVSLLFLVHVQQIITNFLA
jgi:competence protein ComGC